MTAMTLGDMFPELNNCRPAKPAKKKGKDNRKGPGTALRLKMNHGMDSISRKYGCSGGKPVASMSKNQWNATSDS